MNTRPTFRQRWREYGDRPPVARWTARISSLIGVLIAVAVAVILAAVLIKLVIWLVILAWRFVVG